MSAWTGTINTNEGGPGMTGTTNGTFSVTGSGISHSIYSNAPPIDSRARRQHFPSHVDA